MGCQLKLKPIYNGFTVFTTVSPFGPGTILTPNFSLIRPNYSNMKWPYNCLVKKIVIGQIDRSISHYFYSRINLFCKKIQSRGGFLEQPGIAYLGAWFTKKSFLDKVKSQAVTIQGGGDTESGKWVNGGVKKAECGSQLKFWEAGA